MLEQSAAFGELMRQSIILAFIAMVASYHKIIRVIASTASNRHDMVNMVAFAELLVAIVALALLPSILYPNVFSGVLSLCSSQTSASIASIGLDNLITTILKPSLLSFCFFSLIGLLVLQLISISPLASSFSGNLFFRMGATFTKKVQTESILRPLAEIFLGCWFGFSASSTCQCIREGRFQWPISPLPIRCVAHFLLALLTVGVKSVLPSLMGIEVVKRGGKLFLASRASLLGYTVHDRAISLSGLGCFQQRGASSCLPLQYTTKRLVKPIYI